MSVSESIAWPKEFQELKVIDGLLRCGICYDYLRTCLVTPCSHNYCSFCIRKSLQYKQQCPMCFKELYEVNLQNNRVLDEIVENFTGIRDKLIRHLRIAEVHVSVQQSTHLNGLSDVNTTPIKLKTLALKINTPQTEIKKDNDSKVKKTPKTDKKKKHVSFQKDNLVIRTDGDDGSDHEPEDCIVLDKENEISNLEKILGGKPSDIIIPEIFLQPVISPKKKNKEQEDVLTVPCPVCNVQIPERNINIHLDSCLYRSERPIRKQTKEVKSKRTPLPKLVYSMMSEKDLRKKLKEHGLTQSGDKKTLISRLQRFILLYNSECDAIEPRPVSAIMQQVENEEKDEKKHQQTHRPAINRNTDPKVIEEENNKYIQENKSSFDALIKSLREKEGKKPKEVTIIDDDEENSASNCHNDKKEDIEIKKDNKHSMFTSGPSTSRASTSAKDKNERPIQIIDESSDDESCVPSVIPRFTPPKHVTVKNTNSGSKEDGGTQNTCTVEVKTTLTRTDKITVNTQKLSDEELGIHNDISSDVNSVYQASDEYEANSSDNESVSLLVTINEEKAGELANGDLSAEDDDDVDESGKTGNNSSSQIEDPDFVLNTQDLEEENTEELFQPKQRVRSAKRKILKSIVSDSDGSGDDNHHDKYAGVEDTPRRSLRKRVKN